MVRTCTYNYLCIYIVNNGLLTDFFSSSSLHACRQIVQYVADLWTTYKSHRLQLQQQQQGHAPISMTTAPPGGGEGGGEGYSLSRLQVEFDQFVFRAIKWILTAHKYVCTVCVYLRMYVRIYTCMYVYMHVQNNLPLLQIMMSLGESEALIRIDFMIGTLM